MCITKGTPKQNVALIIQQTLRQWIYKKFPQDRVPLTDILTVSMGKWQKCLQQQNSTGKAHTGSEAQKIQFRWLMICFSTVWRLNMNRSHEEEKTTR